MNVWSKNEENSRAYNGRDSLSARFSWFVNRMPTKGSIAGHRKLYILGKMFFYCLVNRQPFVYVLFTHMHHPFVEWVKLSPMQEASDNVRYIDHKCNYRMAYFLRWTVANLRHLVASHSYPYKRNINYMCFF